jgi:S-adenosyl methyltransferase
MTEPEPTAGQPASPLAPPGIDTTVAHPARMLNYVPGGTANFPVDRETADRTPASPGPARTWSPATAPSPANRDAPHRP